MTPRSNGGVPPDAGERAVARAARMRRGMYILPSLFTAGSIGAGYFAITQTFDALTATTVDGSASHLDWAAKAICFAIPFDALDGRIARMTNTTSEFGKELDSLADAITFGVAPCLLAWVWGFHSLPSTIDPDLHRLLLQVGSFVCFLFLLCGVSRLARFNSSHNAQPRNPGRADRKYFVGMPIPAAAGVIAATVHCFDGKSVQYWWLALLWLVLVGLLGFLMVSTWRFWSGKEINFSRRQPFQLIAILAIVLFALLYWSRWALFSVGLVYMFSGIWARAAYSWSRRRRHMTEPEFPARAGGAAFRDEYLQHVAEPVETAPVMHAPAVPVPVVPVPEAPVHPEVYVGHNESHERELAASELARLEEERKKSRSDEY